MDLDSHLAVVISGRSMLPVWNKGMDNLQGMRMLRKLPEVA